MTHKYDLLDSGDFEKLEKFGEFILRRPDPQAIWKKSLPLSLWQKADATFDKVLPESKALLPRRKALWQKNKELPESWIVEIAGIKLAVSLGAFKHVGVFPEHAENWEWIKEVVKGKNMKVLNLFGYTGGASLAAAKAGAEVVHLDASKVSVQRAKENADLNVLKDAPIRYIVEDADTFLKKEIGRGNKYDGLVLDPPSFGRGAKGEVWKIEEGLLSLLEKCKKVLKEDGFLLLNGYAEGFSEDSYAQAISSVFSIPLSKIEKGQLSIAESTPRAFSLPAGIFARVRGVL